MYYYFYKCIIIFIQYLMYPFVLYCYRYQVWCHAGSVDRSLCHHVFAGDPVLLLPEMDDSLPVEHGHRHCKPLDSSAGVNSLFSLCTCLSEFYMLQRKYEIGHSICNAQAYYTMSRHSIKCLIWYFIGTLSDAPFHILPSILQIAFILYFAYNMYILNAKLHSYGISIQALLNCITKLYMLTKLYDINLIQSYTQSICLLIP